MSNQHSISYARQPDAFESRRNVAGQPSSSRTAAGSLSNRLSTTASSPPGFASATSYSSFAPPQPNTAESRPVWASEYIRTARTYPTPAVGGALQRISNPGYAVSNRREQSFAQGSLYVSKPLSARAPAPAPDPCIPRSVHAPLSDANEYTSNYAAPVIETPCRGSNGPAEGFSGRAYAGPSPVTGGPCTDVNASRKLATEEQHARRPSGNDFSLFHPHESNYRERRRPYAGSSQLPNNSTSRGQQEYTQLDPAYKERRGKYFVVGRVFLMMQDQPAGRGLDDQSSCTFNSFGQPIHTKARRFIVVRSHMQSCLAVPITTYSGRGVAKDHVKKSDHCIAHTGSVSPDAEPSELPIAGESGMQPIPIRIDSDDKEKKLDKMSRIDFAKPQTVQYYSIVKNFGKVNERSMYALLSQFQNVMDPSRVRRTLAPSLPSVLQSSRSRHVQAYSALINHGWTAQEAAEYVNINIRAQRSERAVAEVSSSDSERDESQWRSDQEG